MSFFHLFNHLEVFLSPAVHRWSCKGKTPIQTDDNWLHLHTALFLLSLEGKGDSVNYACVQKCPARAGGLLNCCIQEVQTNCRSIRAFECLSPSAELPRWEFSKRHLGSITYKTLCGLSKLSAWSCHVSFIEVLNFWHHFCVFWLCFDYLMVTACCVGQMWLFQLNSKWMHIVMYCSTF